MIPLPFCVQNSISYSHLPGFPTKAQQFSGVQEQQTSPFLCTPLFFCITSASPRTSDVSSLQTWLHTPTASCTAWCCNLHTGFSVSLLPETAVSSKNHPCPTSFSSAHCLSFQFFLPLLYVPPLHQHKFKLFLITMVHILILYFSSSAHYIILDSLWQSTLRTVSESSKQGRDWRQAFLFFPLSGHSCLKLENWVQ
jgi:hypothetical protein